MDGKGIVVALSEDDFVAQMRGLGEEEVRTLGPAMAADWALLNYQAMRVEAKKHASGIDDVFGDFCIDDKPSAMNLELVDWNGELVSAVLRDVDDGVVQKEIEKKEKAYWMEERFALRILRSQRIDEVGVVSGGGSDGDSLEE